MTSDLERKPDAGWYGDPLTRGRERWWDGSAWTDQIRNAPPAAVPASWQLPPRPEPAPAASSVSTPGPGLDPFQPVWGQAPGPGQVRPGAPGATPVPRPETSSAAVPETTPPASFGSRVLATLIDLLLVHLVAIPLAMPFLRSSLRVAEAMVEQFARPMPDPAAIERLVATIPVLDQLAVLGIVALVWFCYSGVMLAWRRGTLGQLALGLRTVAADDHEQALGLRAWSRSFLWAVVWLAGNTLPLVFVLVWSCLRMLWHPRKQTLVDSLAQTRVVRRRR